MTSRPVWRTSSHSNNGGECVEVATAGRIIAVRDTKDRAGVVLRVPAQAWQRFAAAIKAKN